MGLRDFVLHNFRWKLTALLLAMLVWFVIKFAIYKESASGHTQTLTKQPVMTLRAPDDSRTFRIQPPTVDLVVQAAKEVRAGELEVFVNVTSMPDVDSVFKQVLVRGADAAKVLEVRPWGVTVERTVPSDNSLTNSFRKP